MIYYRIACLSVAALACMGTAQARVATGFGSFKVQDPSPATPNPYQCLTEDNGAVANNCTGAENLVFDTPIDHSGVKTITVQDYWNGPTPFVPFTCDVYEYAGTGLGTLLGGVTFSATGQSRSLSVTTKAGDSLGVICWTVPVQEGMASVSWTP